MRQQAEKRTVQRLAAVARGEKAIGRLAAALVRDALQDQEVNAVHILRIVKKALMHDARLLVDHRLVEKQQQREKDVRESSHVDTDETSV